MNILSIIVLMLLSTVVTLGALYLVGNILLPFFGIKVNICIKFYKAKAL